MRARLDVRRMLVRRGWQESGATLLKKGLVTVSYQGTDVFVTGPALRRSGKSTAVLADLPACAIVGLCEAWAVETPKGN